MGLHDSKSRRLLLFPLVVTINCYNQWDYMIVNSIGYYCSHWLLLSIAIIFFRSQSTIPGPHEDGEASEASRDLCEGKATA